MAHKPAISRVMAYHCAIVIPILFGLAACTPNMVREPYPVEIVREVVKPIPAEYTKPLPVPELPQGRPLTVLDLAEYIKAWKAWGKVANQHRAKAKALTDP